MRHAGPIVLTVLLALLSPPSRAAGPPLVILADTGERRDGLPVLETHPDAAATAATLQRGISGVLVRLYALEQAYLAAAEGVTPEPVYVLLSNQRGGYARYGFHLGDVPKPEAGFVDVHRDWPVAGSFGALDQIVPHELAHVIRHQLAGDLEDGGTNQVHAIGVRTDPVVAFNEGFAEHFQAMAIDHPDADPATAALATDHASFARVERDLDAFRRELIARLAVAPRMRMGFVAWYSNDEDVLRYSAVKENAFARAPRIPERLLAGDDPYAAYLLDSVLPGAADDPPRPVPRLVSTEGVVSTLFYRWANDEALTTAFRDDAFYARFGVGRDDVSPLENAYLKIFHVLYEHKPQRVLEFVRGYQETFPEEAGRVETLVTGVFLGQTLETPNEIWLANPDFRTGTTLFDQYRGLPRPHTFDLNAASEVDLAGVPDVTPGLGRAIIESAPYASVDDLARVAGMTPDVHDTFRRMTAEMQRLRDGQASGGDLSLPSILMPFVRRAVGVVLVAALLGAVLYRLVRSWRRGEKPRPGWGRTVINGLAAALIATVCGWAAGGLLAAPASVVAVTVVFGAPAALFARGWRPLAAWAAAALPAALMVTPVG